MNIKLTELPEKEYIDKFLNSGGKRHWYGYPRAFVVGNEIFLNKDAFFLLGTYSKMQLIAHETGHVLGMQHSWVNPVMNPWGIFRP